MSVGRAILLITLVIPGLLAAISSLYSFNIDYEEMGRTERYVERLVRDTSTSQRQLEIAYHRSLAHRVNALANGTWGYIGAAIAALGIHGMATIKDDSIQDQRKKTSS